MGRTCNAEIGGQNPQQALDQSLWKMAQKGWSTRYARIALARFGEILDGHGFWELPGMPKSACVQDVFVSQIFFLFTFLLSHNHLIGVLHMQLTSACQ